MPTLSKPRSLFNNEYVNNGALTRSQPVILEGIRSGERVPAWRQKITLGRDASSPFVSDVYNVISAKPLSTSHTYVRTESFPGAGNWIWRTRYTGGYTFDASVIGPFDHALGATTEDDNIALARLYKKIREDRTKVNGLLFLGELRETIQLIRSPARTAARYVERYLDDLKSTRQVVRKRVRPRKSDTTGSLVQRRLNAVKNEMSGSWLQLQFGLIPAVSDAQDILQEVASQLTDAKAVRLQRAVGRSKLRESITVPYKNVGTFYYQCMNYSRSLEKRSSVSVQYIAGLRNAVEGPYSSVHKAQESLGFSLENFVPTIYELLPWSFLVDYFTNLGDIVEAATTNTDNVVYCTKTVRQITNFKFREELSPYSETSYDPKWVSFSIGGNSSAVREVQRRTVTRTVIKNIPIPTLEFEIPDLIKAGGDEINNKWLNMGALLAQARNFKF